MRLRRFAVTLVGKQSRFPARCSAAGRCICLQLVGGAGVPPVRPETLHGAQAQLLEAVARLLYRSETGLQEALCRAALWTCEGCGAHIRDPLS